MEHLNVIYKTCAKYPGLVLKKYKNKVFYDNLWDDDMIENRGHIEYYGKTVCNPFTKVFNRFENGTDISLDEECLYVRKINGFMIAATNISPFGTVISSTGSMDSKFVDLGKSYLPSLDAIGSGTHLFEICALEDPHIIQERLGAYLIGIRDVDDTNHYFSTPAIEASLDAMGERLNVIRPSWGVKSFAEIVDDVNSCRHEGFLVYGQESKKVLKLKSPYYIALKALARVKDVTNVDINRIAKQYHSLVNHVKDKAELFNALTEQDRLEYMRNYLRG